MDRDKVLRFLALVHIITGLDIILFWAGFYSGILFPLDLLAPRIPNFEGYYAWETSFTLPDMVLAAAMLWGGVRLWRNTRDRVGRSILLAASGGAIFLGLLDATYDSRHGMYGLGHFYSWVLLMIGIYMPAFGIVSIYLLARDEK